MSEQKRTRNVPRHTVTPTDGGSVTIEPTTVEAKAEQEKEASSKKAKSAGEGNA